jgi:hypothetical protein
MWIAAGVALIILAAKAPFWTLAIILIAALVLMTRRNSNGFLSEIARDLREGWDRASEGQSYPPQGPSTSGTPSPAATTGGANSSSSTSTGNTNTTSSTGSGDAGTRS